ncbi:hypothetical protein PAPYR_13521 [Paratrimastix pyriformis]|uniref:Uncharacterized protein n=1 Tax=Paratrimastix pyriformis TaxID=342808 RepID=A0ABQ8U4Z4_9EUKA|nr:hypothetical protein PAPYR_13521 [Paratrimastix pyriformis]
MSHAACHPCARAFVAGFALLLAVVVLGGAALLFVLADGATEQRAMFVSTFSQLSILVSFLQSCNIVSRIPIAWPPAIASFAAVMSFVSVDLHFECLFRGVPNIVLSILALATPAIALTIGFSMALTYLIVVVAKARRRGRQAPVVGAAGVPDRPRGGTGKETAPGGRLAR